MSDPDNWERRRRFIEAGARAGGVAGMKAAERAWREREKHPHIYEDQDPACQDGPCGSAPLGCADKRYCPKR